MAQEYRSWVIGMFAAFYFYPPLDRNAIVAAGVFLFLVPNLLYGVLWALRQLLSSVALLKALYTATGIVLATFAVLLIVNGALDRYPSVEVRTRASDPDAAAKETDSASMPNMEVHILAQPDVKRLQKNDEVRFTGTLAGYQQSPLLLTWDNAKINAEDLHPAPASGKQPLRPAAPRKPHP